jgi:cell division FtsZ-interacting protein ZapD
VFFNRTLSTIIADFAKVETKLHKHLDRKTDEHLTLLADKADIEDRIDATVTEAERTHRILAKVQEFTA